MTIYRRTVPLLLAAALVVGGTASCGRPTKSAAGSLPSGSMPGSQRRTAALNLDYTYAGCPVFPGTPGGQSGGWYNTDVSAAQPASDSAQLIANYIGSGGSSGGFSIMGPQYPAQEVINTPASVSLYPVVRSHWTTPTATMLPGPATTYSGSGPPDEGALLIEGAAGSDGQYHVVERGSCRYWSAGATSWSGTGFRVWNAAVYDLRKPQPLGPEYGSVGDCCGLPMIAFLIKPGELQAGRIGHALGWISPGNEGGSSPVDPHNFVPPAVEAQGGSACTTPAPCMPYGAHVRLHASFDDSDFSPSAKAVAEALKHYGAYLMDTGCCLGIAYLSQDWSGVDVNAYWSSADDSALQTIHMSDMDVISPEDSDAPN